MILSAHDPLNSESGVGDIQRCAIPALCSQGVPGVEGKVSCICSYPTTQSCEELVVPKQIKGSFRALIGVWLCYISPL